MSGNNNNTGSGEVKPNPTTTANSINNNSNTTAKRNDNKKVTVAKTGTKNTANSNKNNPKTTAKRNDNKKVTVANTGTTNTANKETNKYAIINTVVGDILHLLYNEKGAYSSARRPNASALRNNARRYLELRGNAPYAENVKGGSAVGFNPRRNNESNMEDVSWNDDSLNLEGRAPTGNDRNTRREASNAPTIGRPAHNENDRNTRRRASSDPNIERPAPNENGRNNAERKNKNKPAERKHKKTPPSLPVRLARVARKVFLTPLRAAGKLIFAPLRGALSFIAGARTGRNRLRA